MLQAAQYRLHAPLWEFHEGYQLGKCRPRVLKQRDIHVFLNRCHTHMLQGAGSGRSVKALFPQCTSFPLRRVIDKSGIRQVNALTANATKPEYWPKYTARTSEPT